MHGKMLYMYMNNGIDTLYTGSNHCKEYAVFNKCSHDLLWLHVVLRDDSLLNLTNTVVEEMLCFENKVHPKIKKVHF